MADDSVGVIVFVVVVCFFLFLWCGFIRTYGRVQDYNAGRPVKPSFITTQRGEVVTGSVV